MGCSPQSKVYKLYNPVSGKVIISRDVRFNETGSWAWNEKNISAALPNYLISHDVPESPVAE